VVTITSLRFLSVEINTTVNDVLPLRDTSCSVKPIEVNTSVELDEAEMEKRPVESDAVAI
jgi:hypothetical protein